MKCVKLLLLVLIFTPHNDATTIVSKNMTIKNISFIDTAALCDSTKNEFVAMSSQQKYTLLKCKVKYIISGEDTLRFTNKIGYYNVPVADTPIGRLENNRRIVLRGIVATGIGIGVKYGFTRPLYLRGGDLFMGGMFGDTSSSAFDGLLLLTASLFTNFAGDALIILGATRSGFAASNSYHLDSSGMKKNINWGLYGAGLGFVGIEFIGLCVSFASLGSPKTSNLTLPALGISFISSSLSYVMFVASTVNASIYTQKSYKRAVNAGVKLQLAPTVSFAQKSAGLVLNCSF